MKNKMRKELLIAVQNAKKVGLSDREILEVVLQGTATTKIQNTSFEEVISEQTGNIREITNVLREFCIGANLKGYNYIREAIQYRIKNPNCAVTKEMYPEVAKKFKTTASRVERAIRHAIESAWDSQKVVEVFEKYFGNQQPTNGEFIAAIADKIRLEE